MTTIHLHDIPDDVIERLTILAARAGLSVSSFATTELTAVVDRTDNETLLSTFPDLGVGAKAIVADVETGRADR